MKENRIMAAPRKSLGTEALILSGALLLAASYFLGWIDRPILGWIKGRNIRLSEDLPGRVSYGVLFLSMALLSCVSLSKRFRWMSFASGAAGILLSLHFFFTFALFDSRRIIGIDDLNRQENLIISFKKFLPPNLGVEPTFDASISTDTITDRLYATFHAVTLGWYAAVLGSLFILAAFANSRTAGKTGKFSFTALAAIILSYLLLSLAPYLLSEHYLKMGDAYLAKGMYAGAVDEYALARRWDPNLGYQDKFHINLGKAYFYLGKTNEADYYIYKGSLLTRADAFPTSLFYYKKAALIDPSVSNTVGSHLISRVYTNEGLYRYRKGNAALAIDTWKMAIAANPAEIDVYYFLTRAYYDISAYEDSILTGLQFLKLSHNNIIRANICSDIADSYYKLKKFAPAREFYLKSLFFDKYYNLRAVMSTVGR
ncbi:MAG: tetratricopeptide repeat protein [Nitrospiraceae bacterium]|nr:tetratricopeptide repeat protein [Nitrospiraceae bacterium]